MISQSFIFLDKVGRTTENKIWQTVSDWDSFLKKEKIPGLGLKKKKFYDSQLLKTKTALINRDLKTLAKIFPKNEHWRLYNKFKERILFFDIETGSYYSDITVLGAYDGEEYYCFVKGCNLEKELIKKLFDSYDILVSFNGSSFDIPVINRFFGKIITEDKIHIDLRHVLFRLGFSGGLKSIEEVLGIARKKEIINFQGSDAGYLWQEYMLTKNEDCMKLLIEYNEADCRNLEPLAEFAIKKLWKQLRVKK